MRNGYEVVKMLGGLAVFGFGTAWVLGIAPFETYDPAFILLAVLVGVGVLVAVSLIDRFIDQ
jgi:CHASE1-domain containing sensor protein